MKSPDVRQEKLCTAFCRLLFFSDRYEVCHLCKTVHDNPYSNATFGKRKLDDEVHGYRIPWRIGQLKRMQGAMPHQEKRNFTRRGSASSATSPSSPSLKGGNRNHSARPHETKNSQLAEPRPLVRRSN